MAQSFIIAFREILEIAIILSIILAATRGVPGRGRWLWLGLAGGLLGSAVVAAFAETISNAAEGMGQEVFNAIILFAAVLMIGWTVVWMQTHGREIAQKMKHVGHAVKAGELPLYSVSIVIALAMWREGAEIVLFMTGILSTSQESLLAIIAGSTAGGALAAAIGSALYFGLIRIHMKHLFSVTSALLILVACGMSSQAVGYLIAADMLPALGQMWDSSTLLSENTTLGKILGAMVGYTAQPSGMQLVFYIATASIITSLMMWQRKTAACAQPSKA